MKDTVLNERTLFSVGLLIPIGLVIGAWIDLAGDSRVHANQIAALERQQNKTEEKYDKILDVLGDVKADLKTLQNQLKR